MLIDEEVNFFRLAVQLLPADVQLGLVVKFEIRLSLRLLFDAPDFFVLLRHCEEYLLLVDAGDCVADIDLLPGRLLRRHNNAHRVAS